MDFQFLSFFLLFVVIYIAMSNITTIPYLFFLIFIVPFIQGAQDVVHQGSSIPNPQPSAGLWNLSSWASLLCSARSALPARNELGMYNSVTGMHMNWTCASQSLGCACPVYSGPKSSLHAQFVPSPKHTGSTQPTCWAACAQFASSLEYQTAHMQPNHWAVYTQFAPVQSKQGMQPSQFSPHRTALWSKKVEHHCCTFPTHILQHYLPFFFKFSLDLRFWASTWHLKVKTWNLTRDLG